MQQRGPSVEHDARESLDGFFESSLDLLCHLGFDGYFRRLNPAWERTLGWTREELMSRPFIEFVHPDDHERTLRQNAAVRAGGQALGFENRYLCRDGSFRWLLWNATPHDARIIYSVARDITERKRLEQERERLVRELRAALHEVNELKAILPICSYCRRIRDDDNYWHSVENYLSRHTKTLFSHGICPTCVTTIVEPKLNGGDSPAGDTPMDEERFNLEIRRFLKTFGVTAQREIENAVREGMASGRLAGRESLELRAVLTIDGLLEEHVVTGEVSLE